MKRTSPLFKIMKNYKNDFASNFKNRHKIIKDKNQKMKLKRFIKLKNYKKSCIIKIQKNKMSKWPTLDEMLNSPIQIKHPDPFFHSQQFPRFMRRKVFLPDTFDKNKQKSNFPIEKKRHRRTVSENSPSQKVFQAYGRVAEQVKSIFEKDSLPKDSSLYDEALDNQEIFIKLTPKQSKLKSDFKISYCPREIQSNSVQRGKKRKKNKSFVKIPHKITTKPDEKLKELTSSNVLALISRNSPKKCGDCGHSKCECVIVDEEIPDTVYDNIKKGRLLIDSSKRKNVKPKVCVSKPDSRIKTLTAKNNFFEELMQYSVYVSKKKDPNTLEGKSVLLHDKYRRYST